MRAKSNLRSHFQWWSLETWSRSRDSSRDPFLRVLVSKVLGLETLNIAKKWFIKIYIIQIFLFVVFAGKKQPKHVGKMPETWRNPSQKHGRLQKRFQGGQTWYFAYPLHVADETVPITGGKGSTIPRAPNQYEGAIKSQQCHKYFLQYRTFASERSQVRT